MSFFMPDRLVGARRSRVAAVCALTAAASVATMPSASADAYTPGVTARTVWSPSTPLFDARGTRVAGLRSASTGGNGVGDIDFGRLGDALIAEKNGRIIYFPQGSDTSGTLLTDLQGRDLSPDVLSSTDTGLSAVTFDPGWPRKPYIYALYTSNAKHPSQGTGKWRNQDCPEDGRCIVDGKLERLTVSTRQLNGRPVRYISGRTVLVGSGWCQAARTHSVGDLVFGPDGYLYASAGDGTPPYGGNATQRDLCASQVTTKYPSQMAPLDGLDPNVPVSLNGKVIRISPVTGAGAPGNPWASSADPQRRRVVAMGFRNPYRLAFNTTTNTLAISMGGQTAREAIYEINRTTQTKVANAGWPCWEASVRFSDGPLCNGLSQSAGTVMKPAVEWSHNQAVVSGEPCPAANPSVAMGVTYGASKVGPTKYRQALFFNDFGRGCLWYRPPGQAPRWLGQVARQSVRSISTHPHGQVWFGDYKTGSIKALVMN